MYEQYQPAMNWSRIEMLLAAYDGTLSRLENAANLIEQDEIAKAAPLLLRAQRLVTELYAGLDLKYGAIPQNMQKIYIFVLGAIAEGDVENIRSAVRFMGTIREALESIREEGIQLERNGQLKSVDREVHQIQHAVG